MKIIFTLAILILVGCTTVARDFFVQGENCDVLTVEKGEQKQEVQAP